MAESDGQFSACHVKLGKDEFQFSNEDRCTNYVVHDNLEVPVKDNDLHAGVVVGTELMNSRVLGKTFDMSCNADVEAAETSSLNLGDQSAAWPAEMVSPLRKKTVNSNKALNVGVDEKVSRIENRIKDKWNWKSKRHKRRHRISR